MTQVHETRSKFQITRLQLGSHPGSNPGFDAMILVFSPGGGGVLPYMGYIGMCGTKGYGFSAVLVINRVSIIAILPPLW